MDIYDYHSTLIMNAILHCTPATSSADGLLDMCHSTLVSFVTQKVDWVIIGQWSGCDLTREQNTDAVETSEKFTKKVNIGRHIFKGD